MENEKIAPIVEEPVVPQVSPEPEKKSNYFKILVVLIGILIVAGLSLNAYLMFSKKETVTKVPDSVTPTANPITDWKTYSNTALGFEIKYPSTVLIEKELNDQNNRVTIFKGGNLNFEVMLRKNPDNISLDKYYFMDAPIKEKTIMGGISANFYEMPTGYCDGPSCSEPFIAVVTEKGSDLYHLTFFGDIKLSEVENQILSTFKFTDQTIDTTNWKTLINSNGFLIKFPQNYNAFLPSIIMFPKGTTINNSPTISIRENNSNEEGKQLVVDVLKTDKSSYQILEESRNYISKNTNVFVSLIEDIHETSFLNKTAYEFSIKSKGFNNTHIGSIGPFGDYKTIAIQDNDKVIIISYYMDTVFDQILSTFKFTSGQ
jgi:hypothetical protein